MLEMLDLKRRLSKALFREQSRPLRLHLNECQRLCLKSNIPTTIVFEGWDAAGKGTHIGELASCLDPRGFRVHPISEPVEDETLRPFLWRFWIRLPEDGHIAVFDRSWYGRVLDDRLDQRIPESDWRRAYEEISQFERTLVDDGMVLIKLWLHISKKEQRKRFRACEKDPLLRFKITKDEWRRHRRYDEALFAIEEMLEKTSSQEAPWTVIEATNQRFAEIKILETIVQHWELALRAKDIPFQPWTPQTLAI